MASKKGQRNSSFCIETAFIESRL